MSACLAAGNSFCNNDVPSQKAIRNCEPGVLHAGRAMTVADLRMRMHSADVYVKG